MTVSHEEFIPIWQRAGCVQDVVVATGMSRAHASMRAHYLRKRLGIPLKEFPKGRRPANVQYLIKLAKESLNGKGK